jgi:hypothetical protein
MYWFTRASPMREAVARRYRTIAENTVMWASKIACEAIGLRTDRRFCPEESAPAPSDAAIC